MNNQNEPASPDVSQGGQPVVPQEQQPIQPQPKKPKPKWLIPLIVIVGIIILGFAVWGGYELFKPSPSELPEGGEAEEDEFKDWKTYINEEYGFEVKYPEGLYTKITKIDESRLIISDLKEMGTQDVLPQEKIHIMITVSEKSLYQELYSYVMNLVGDANKISQTTIGNLKGFRVGPGKYPTISIFVGQDKWVYHLYGINYQNETLDSDNFKLMYQILSTFKFIH